MDRRFDRRQGFLISATVHLILMTLLMKGTEPAARQPHPAPPPSPEARRVRLLPRIPPSLLRPRQPPRPRPAPVPRSGKDRISVGPPSTQRADRLELRRDEDLSAEPGLPARTAEARPPAGREERSITRSLADLDRRLGQMGSGAVEGGAARQMGPLFFDPEGADFTGWVNHFKNEVYRNWIVPEAARLGFRGGHVDFEFWVERDGRMSDLRMLKSSGTPALDRAAENALQGSRLLGLPPDFSPDRVRMQVSFYYNEPPPG